jgi:hypothetical protein
MAFPGCLRADQAQQGPIMADPTTEFDEARLIVAPELRDSPATLTVAPNPVLGSNPAPDPILHRLERLEGALTTLAHSLQPVLANSRYEPAPPFPPPPTPVGFSASDYPRPMPVSPVAAPPQPAAKSHWLEWPFIHELKQIFQMYIDPRYRLSRWGQFAVPGLLVILAANYAMFNWVIKVPVLSELMERIGILVFAIVLYKLLSREVGRYRAVLEYLRQYGR